VFGFGPARVLKKERSRPTLKLQEELRLVRDEEEGRRGFSLTYSASVLPFPHSV